MSKMFSTPGILTETPSDMEAREYLYAAAKRDELLTSIVIGASIVISLLLIYLTLRLVPKVMDRFNYIQKIILSLWAPVVYVILSIGLASYIYHDPFKWNRTWFIWLACSVLTGCTELVIFRNKSIPEIRCDTSNYKR